MLNERQVGTIESTVRIRAGRLAWLWLACGCVLLSFTAWQTVVPIAAWLAPVFLLRFTRTAARTWLARLLVFLAYVLSMLFGSRGMPFSLLGLLGNVILKSSWWALPYGIDRFMGKRLRGWLRSLVFPLAYTTVELGMSHSLITTTGSLAYSQAGVLPLLQVLSITGTFGITFLITWSASIVNELWEHRFDPRSSRSMLVGFAGLMVAAFLFGTVRLDLSAHDSGTVRGASVTIDGELADRAVSSIDWHDWRSDDRRSALRRSFEPTVEQALARTQAALEDGAKLVGWQESGVWVLEEDKARVLQRVESLAVRHGAFVAASMEVVTLASRLPVLRNQSILVDPSGTVRWTYDKSHPAPYDEAFVTIRGTGVLPEVDTPYGHLSAAICYDTYFPSLIRQAGAAGTDIFVAPTNDPPPWAGSMAALASFRAIENGFSMLRPTGHGVSAMIDREGRFIASQDFFTATTGVLTGNLPTRGVRTIYSRIGDAFAYAGAAALAGLAVLAGIRSRRRGSTVPEARRAAA